MDPQQDLMPFWSFRYDPCSVLEDFDQSTFGDLFGHCEPKAAWSDLQSNGVTPLQLCSEDPVLLSKLEAPETVKHKSGREASKAQDHAKESNRRAQQRHRAKIKA